MVEKAGNRFEYDLLERPVDPVLTPVPSQGRFEFQSLALAACDKKRQLLVEFAFEKNYLGLSPRQPHVIHAKSQTKGAADHRVDGAHGKHFERESIDQPADHELNGSIAAGVMRRTELVPEDERGYRMEDRDAEGSTEDRMGG